MGCKKEIDCKIIGRLLDELIIFFIPYLLFVYLYIRFLTIVLFFFKTGYKKHGQVDVVFY